MRLQNISLDNENQEVNSYILVYNFSEFLSQFASILDCIRKLKLWVIEVYAHYTNKLFYK